MTTYRTDNPPFWTGTGVDLTAGQIDQNFFDLRTDVDNLAANPPTANSIESITADGFFWTVTLTDGTILDPLPVPVVYTVWRGEWQPFTLYSPADIFRVTDVGLFAVMVQHTSDATFDAQAVGGSPPALLYTQLIEVSTSHAVFTQFSDYTLVISDADGWIRLTSGTSPPSSIEVTVPLEANVAFVTGTTVAFECTTSGGCTVVGELGVTINCASGFSAGTDLEFGVIQIKKVGTDEWTIFGNLAP